MLAPFLQVFSKGHSISCAGPHESATCPTKPVAVVATKPSSKTPTGSKASSKPGKPSKVKSSADTTLTRLGMKMLYFRIFIAFLTSRERRLEAARAPSGCLDTDRVTHSQWLLEQCKSIRLL